MNDTDPKISERMLEMFKNKSAIERLKMGAGMFDMARVIVISSLNAANESELRAGLFKRFYGSEYSPVQRERILGYLTEKFQKNRIPQ